MSIKGFLQRETLKTAAKKNNQAKILRQRLHIKAARDTSCGTAVGSQTISLQRLDKNIGDKNR